MIKRTRSFLAKEKSQFAAFDMHQAIRDVLQFTQVERARTKVQSLEAFLSPLPQAYGDRVQIQQVLLNLILNAMDAMRPVGDRPHQLRLSTSLADPARIRVSVEDNGIGFDPATTNRMFDPFFTTKTGGTGLGLAISRSIIETHGGQLDVAPAHPHGAAFSFTLPTTSG